MPSHSCAVEECDRPRYAAQTICEPHYRRLRRTGSLGQVPIGAKRVPETCEVEMCDNVATERALCHGHYLRLRRTGKLTPERPLSREVGGDCSVAMCSELVYARAMCRIHYRRFMKHGDPQADRPTRPAAPRSGGRVHRGYRVVPVAPEERWLVNGKNTELEHRLVMARGLGRPLTADESVHHRNGDRLCNDPVNLELWSRWQPRGQRVVDKVQWAVELVQRYAPELLVVQLPLSFDVVPPSRFELPLPP